MAERRAVPLKTREAAQLTSVPGHRGAGTLITIPAGTRHHVRNPGATPTFLLTVYAPPEY